MTISSVKRLGQFLYRQAKTQPDKLCWETYRDANSGLSVILFLAENHCNASMIAQTRGDTAGNFAHQTLLFVGSCCPAYPAMFCQQAFWLRSHPLPCKPCHRLGSFVSLVDVHSQKQKETASQEQPFAEHDGEISWMAYRCNNLPLR